MTSTTSPSTRRIYCNPLDLEYRYQDVRFTGVVRGLTIGEPRRSVHREGADPSLVRYRGRYYLFVSMSRGFWHSDDLLDWQYVATDKIPPYDYAPDVRVVDGALIISASRKTNSPFFRSVDPLADDFEEITPGTFEFWDPHVFQDLDDRVYFYWGCSSDDPIRGVEMDSTFTPIGQPVDLITTDTTTRGWEKTGEDYVVPEPVTEREKLVASFSNGKPYLEGAWMTRVDDTYYLQYAAPGTEWNTYADGYFTGAHPLGPFTYSPTNPFSSKPGGFITGAGHGSTVQDEYGNWWHTATMRISINDVYERRVGLFPAGFDEDGVLYCNQNFGDYPCAVPAGPVDARERIAPEWMLLSYRAAARASSSAEGHLPGLAVNENIRDWWASDGPGRGHWIEIEMDGGHEVHAIQVNLADHELADYASADLIVEGKDQGHTWRGIHADHTAAQFTVEGSIDGQEWVTLHDSRDDERERPHALILLDAPAEYRLIRVRADRVPFDGPFAVSGIRVFGVGVGEPPAETTPRAVRTDGMTAELEWPPVDGAHGYNIRYGHAPDRLYHSWLVYEQNHLRLPSLNDGETVWVSVDSFNENGVTPGRAFEVPPRV